MSISHVGGGDADDDKPADPFDPQGPLVYSNEPKEFGMSVVITEAFVRDDQYDVMRSIHKRLVQEMKQCQEEDAAHTLELHKEPSDYPACRWCNPPPSEPRDECQTWTEGDVSVTKHVSECTCHDDCTDYDY